MRIDTNNLRVAFITVLFALGIAGSASAKQVDASGATIRATIKGQVVAIAFVTLRAHVDAKLVGAESVVATSIDLHEFKRDGMTLTMSPVPEIALPKNKTVELKPGSYHLMLKGLKYGLAADTTVPLTLIFERSNGKQFKQAVIATVTSKGVLSEDEN